MASARPVPWRLSTRMMPMGTIIMVFLIGCSIATSTLAMANTIKTTHRAIRSEMAIVPTATCFFPAPLAMPLAGRPHFSRCHRMRRWCATPIWASDALMGLAMVCSSHRSDPASSTNVIHANGSDRHCDGSHGLSGCRCHPFADWKRCCHTRRQSHDDGRDISTKRARAPSF